MPQMPRPTSRQLLAKADRIAYVKEITWLHSAVNRDLKIEITIDVQALKLLKEGRVTDEVLTSIASEIAEVLLSEVS
jgi:hypothetical protein